MSSSKDFTCSTCSKKFTTTSNLFRHLRKVHKEEVYISSQPKISCPLCEEEKEKNIHSYKELDQHLTDQHGLDIIKENYHFPSENEFINWKLDIEDKTYSRYSRHEGSNHSKLFKTTYYYCHRSGYYKSKGNNLRHLKNQGSCKMNGNCPSRIKATVNKQTAEVTVEFVITHVNHERDLEHLFLSDNNRKWIATKLTEGVNVDRIIDEVRFSVAEHIDRLHLLTKKDIANIKNSIKHSTSFKSLNDELGVEASIKEQSSSSNNDEIAISSQGLKRKRGDIDNLKLKIKKDIERMLHYVENIDSYEQLDQFYHERIQPDVATAEVLANSCSELRFELITDTINEPGDENNFSLEKEIDLAIAIISEQ